MGKGIRILIVEDELIVADYMQDCLSKLDYEITGIAISYDEAVDLLRQDIPDIILMDISLKGVKSGIDLAQYVARNYKVPFIFTSSHSDRSTIDLAKQSLPYAYLIKPFGEEDLYAAIETAMTQFARTQAGKGSESGEAPFVVDNAIFIKNRNRFVKVPLDELIYLEANDNYSTLFVQGNSFVLKTTLKNLQETLPDYFLRIHRSYVVNLRQLKSFSQEEVTVGEKTLPIGKSFFPDFFSRLNVVQG